jgi:hypothetical protein
MMGRGPGAPQCHLLDACMKAPTLPVAGRPSDSPVLTISGIPNSFRAPVRLTGRLLQHHNTHIRVERSECCAGLRPHQTPLNSPPRCRLTLLLCAISRITMGSRPEVHDRLARRRRDDAVGRAPPAVRHLFESRTQHPPPRLARAASRSACSEAASSASSGSSGQDQPLLAHAVVGRSEPVGEQRGSAAEAEVVPTSKPSGRGVQLLLPHFTPVIFHPNAAAARGAPASDWDAAAEEYSAPERTSSTPLAILQWHQTRRSSRLVTAICAGRVRDRTNRFAAAPSSQSACLALIHNTR